MLCGWSFCLLPHANPWSNVLLSYSIHIQPLKPGPKEVINHGYTVSTKEDGILIAKNLKFKQNKSKLIYLPTDIFIDAKYKYLIDSQRDRTKVLILLPIC